MIQVAILSALAYFITYGFNWLVGTSMTERPIVVGAVTGFLLGDLRTGVMMGAALEAVFMGNVNIGGQMSADPAAATVFAVAFATQQSVNADTALTLAIPIGVLLGFVLMFVNNVFLTVFVPLIDKYAEESNERGLTITLNYGIWLGKNIVFAVVIFVGVYAGHSAVQVFIENIPEVVLSGLTLAGRLLPAVGISVLLKMLWSKEIAAYYFLGFILVIYLGLPLIAVAVLGAIAAYISSMRDMDTLRHQELKISNGANSLTNEEDFFQ